MVITLDIDMGGRVDFICRKDGKYYRTEGTAAEGEQNMFVSCGHEERETTTFTFYFVCFFFLSSASSWSMQSGTENPHLF